MLELQLLRPHSECPTPVCCEEVDTGHFQHCYTDFGCTNLGVPKFDHMWIKSYKEMQYMI